MREIKERRHRLEKYLGPIEVDDEDVAIRSMDDETMAVKAEDDRELMLLELRMIEIRPKSESYKDLII
ncbi:hypothetical protein PanWU01x14_159520 [Parasponia andersonii]|uniref:Uncharacterized protein n=1 Tax=Parasponia andersonii TaxID=3476 RepID=A0A2P5CEF9_PARAD|nr:hypothetical protein PanWU01x14_159520 [Parasponia andersonii]